MRQTSCLLTLLTLAMTGPVGAGPIYQLISPDGKTLYSDKLPSGAGKLTVIDLPETSSPAPATEAADTPTAGGDPNAPKPPQTPENALATILAAQSVAAAIESLCASTDSSSIKATLSNWEKRHAADIVLAQRLLPVIFGPESSQQLKNQIDTRISEHFTPFKNASMTERMQRCDEFNAEVEKGELDISGDAAFLGRIQNGPGN